MTFFSEKFPFSRPKILMTFLLSSTGFSDFPFLFPNFPYLYCVKWTISEKDSLTTPFFTLFVLSRASDNTTSQNIGGTDAWAVPHLKFRGRPPRSPPLAEAHERSTNYHPDSSQSLLSFEFLKTTRHITLF